MDYATVQSGDFTITSNAESADAMSAALETSEEGQAAAADTGKLSAESAEEAAPASPSDAATSETKPTNDKSTEDKKNARHSMQARLNVALAKQREAEDERDRVRTELLAAREAAKAPTREPEPAKPQPVAASGDDPTDPQPKIEDFASSDDPYGDHLLAKAAWKARQEYRKLEQERTQREQVTQRQQTVQTRTASAQAACVEKIRANTNGDATFYDKLSKDVLNLRPVGLLGANEQPTGQTAIADCILDSDVPDKLLVYFTEHADDFQRLSTLHPYQTIREMGRLEARLTAAPSGPASTVRPISAAKPPIKPVGGSPSVTDDSDDDTDDLSEAAITRHIKRENAKDIKSARR